MSSTDLSCGLIVNYRNPEPGLIERCVASIEEQEYTNWRAYLCDDASAIGVTIEGDKIIRRRNGMRLGMVANSVYSIAQSREDIIIHVDGDDHLSPLALNYIVEAHANGADMTWGSCKSQEVFNATAGGANIQYRIANYAQPFTGDLNTFSAPMPRSYRRALFLEAWEKWGWSAFTHRSGKQWPHAGDIAILYPLLRLARSPQPIREILYYINRTGPSHDRQRRVMRKAIIQQAEGLPC